MYTIGFFLFLFVWTGLCTLILPISLIERHSLHFQLCNWLTYHIGFSPGAVGRISAVFYELFLSRS